MVGFPKFAWVSPTQNDQHLGCEMGVRYHHLKETPQIMYASFFCCTFVTVDLLL